MIKLVIYLLATLTLAADVFIFLYFLVHLLRIKQLPRYKKIVQKNSLKLVFLISGSATLGSLFFSEIAKFTPCILCWWQRIFMYPQPFLTFLALKRKEELIFPYLTLLNLIGLLIALYHYLIQILPATTSSFCQIGGTVSCTKNFTFYFGYITIPLMAASAFLLNILLLKDNVKNNHRT